MRCASRATSSSTARTARRPLLHEATAGALGHADDGVGEKSAMVVIEPGVDQWLDCGGDGVLHRT